MWRVGTWEKYAIMVLDVVGWVGWEKSVSAVKTVSMTTGRMGSVAIGIA